MKNPIKKNIFRNPKFSKTQNLILNTKTKLNTVETRYSELMGWCNLFGFGNVRINRKK